MIHSSIPASTNSQVPHQIYTTETSSTPHFLTLSVNSLHRLGTAQHKANPIWQSVQFIRLRHKFYTTLTNLAHVFVSSVHFISTYASLIIRWSSIRSAAKFVRYYITRGRSPFLTPNSINLYYLNVYKMKMYWL